MTHHTYAGHALAEIKEAAEKATPGNWRFENVQYGNGLELVSDHTDEHGILWAESDCGEPRIGFESSSDLSHITTANPATVLAMVARIEELEKAMGGICRPL